MVGLQKNSGLLEIFSKNGGLHTSVKVKQQIFCSEKALPNQ